MDNSDPRVAVYPKGISAALMGTQLCPRTIQQHRASVGGKVGEVGGPDGDAVRAENATATAVQETAAAGKERLTTTEAAAGAAARQQHPKGASAALMGTQLHPREGQAERHSITTTNTFQTKQDAREFQNSLVPIAQANRKASMETAGGYGGSDGDAVLAKQRVSGGCGGPDGDAVKPQTKQEDQRLQPQLRLSKNRTPENFQIKLAKR